VWDRFVVLISHCVTICTVVHWHDTAYTYVNIWSAPTVHCVRLLFIVITVNECCTSSPVHAQSHSYCNGTANCTVGHHCEALLFLGQNAFNANSVEEKLLFPFHVPQGAQTKYIYIFFFFSLSKFGSTQVIHKRKHQIIKHFFAEDICSPSCSTVCTYIHTYIHTCCHTVSWICQHWKRRVDGSCKYEQRKVYCLVEKSTWTVLYTANGLLCYVNIIVCIYVICVTNLRVSSFSLPSFNDCSRLQSDQNQ
jgi:hypothetical protein